MEIGPLQSKRQVVDSVKEKTGKQPAPVVQKRQADRLDLSSVYTRDKLARLADEELVNYSFGSSRISEQTYEMSENHAQHDKVRLIRTRMKSGFYDQPDIIRKIAEKLADEFGSSTRKDNI